MRWLDELVEDGLGKPVDGLPAAVMLAAPDGAPAHSMEFVAPRSLIFRLGPPVNDAPWLAAYHAGQPETGMIAHIDPDCERSQVDPVLSRTPRAAKRGHRAGHDCRGAPVPRYGRLFSVQGVPDGDWLAARPVWSLAQATRWAGTPQAKTLHVGTPGDAGAKIPLPTMHEVGGYIETRSEDKKAGRAVVYRPVDGHAWASHLRRKVYMPPGQPDDEGRVWIEDQDGNRYESLIAALIYAPAEPGSAPEPPGILSHPLAQRVREGLLTPVEGVPTAFMVTVPEGTPEHSVELMAPNDLIIRRGPPVKDAAWRAVYRARPAGRRRDRAHRHGGRPVGG